MAFGRAARGRREKRPLLKEAVYFLLFIRHIEVVNPTERAVPKALGGPPQYEGLGRSFNAG
jgi:hypothetical protein